jgi:hypothetical protein
MIVNDAFILVFNIILFPDACFARQARTTTQNTWTWFKVDVLTARRKFCLTNQMVQQSGFHSMNMMIENNRDGALQGNADVISQLVIADASTHGTEASLTATNPKLTIQLKASQA